MSFSLRMRPRVVIPVVGLVAVVIAVALLSSRAPERPGAGPGLAGSDPVAGDKTSAVIWTCSMHPQIRQPKPGDCPICGMDLVPVEEEPTSAGAEDARWLTVSEAAAKLMEIATSPVERRVVEVEVPMVGKVTYDETRVSRIAAWVPGRIERLFVDYTGYVVKQGDPMAELYSPELLAAQEELIQARGAVQRAEGGGGAVDRPQATLDAVRERLSLWGLSEGQIREIEERGTAEPRMAVLAPSGGTVVEKSVTEGMYVDTGMEIFTIADLSRVWIALEAYESDLAWLRTGQHAVFTVEGHPGETFEGAVSFVEPTVDPVTRTVEVRLEAPNGGGRLKPGMFVRATVHARDGGAARLVVPATAPLLTGSRAVVYVEVPGAELPTYEGRDVVLGPRGGDYYVVLSGLREGERVVTEGNFKIDSALQIRAKPSMMSPEGGAVGATGHAGHATQAADVAGREDRGGVQAGHEGH